MSYDVDVMMSPVPSADDEAWRVLQAAEDEQGEPAPIFRVLHDRLTARFPCFSTLSDEEIDGPLSIWSSGPLWSDFVPRIGRLAIQFPKVESALPFILETARQLDLVVFDWQTRRIHRGDGLYGLKLELESQFSLHAPTLAEIDSSFARLTAYGEPGFLILESDASGDYAQTSAGEEGYIVEWREHRDGGFRHFAAGRPTSTPGRIDTNSGLMSIPEGECLSADDAKAILRAFASGDRRPDRFVWRDMSADFTPHNDAEEQADARTTRPWWKFWG